MIQYKFKLTLLGEGGVGKTSLRRTFLGETFREDYILTMGSDFASKKISLNNINYNLLIWDLAGQPLFKNIRQAYYRGCRGALVLFDLTRIETFRLLPNWIEELVSNNKNERLPIVLIGNKADLKSNKEAMHPKYGKQYAEELSVWSGYEVPYIETSALTGENVDIVFTKLVEQIVIKDKKEKLESVDY